LTSEVRLSGRDLFASQIPARPYCADYYDEGVHPRNREHALRRRHVQFNQPHSVDWLIFDIDRDEAYRAAEDANLPQPNVLAINPSKDFSALLNVHARDLSGSARLFEAGVRSYLLDSTFQGPLGYGWTHSYRMRAIEIPAFSKIAAVTSLFHLICPSRMS
jgi:hypothetical protein